ncbi:hypothetical protein LF65_00968 [Clostridium beijerinckii]|uniref:NACHT-associated inactive Restriction Endonuclease 1 sensor domain-containing protein n=1 Tax=Clostridium beijerinckii TaxID=1520 RepID=A0A0B5Q5W3_CLOBE|nr:hypothetical protein [Clostridium beijerinckii]AJG97589.1 hypothetical protein LF65_00968 [Clostridium beijerinckii]
MSFKIPEKISDISVNSIQAFTGNNKENILNDARKAGEAICKLLIYSHYGDSLGENIILGKVDCNGNPISRPVELEFWELIKVTCKSNSVNVIISHKGTRNRIKAYLELLRTHGNPASHDPNNFDDKIDIRHVNVVKTTLSNLLTWLFIDYLHYQLPDKLAQYIKFYSEVSESAISASDSRLSKFKINLQEWFKALGYEFGHINIEDDDRVIFVVKIPERRKIIDVLVYAITTEIKVEHIDYVNSLIKNYDCQEGWIITDYTVSNAAKDFCETEEQSDIFCYNFDELIEETIDFSKYFNWIEAQINDKNIDEHYVQLACEKVELHSKTKRFMAKSIYNESNGWMEGYIDIWIEDNQKEHISILGEFGTGKTWFTLHYTWRLIKKYKEAKAKRLPRPRIPIFIQLRDFSKALSVETLISDFFFRKHNIEIMGAFNAFKQLNKMGKLILIFDGFDEMADKVDKQKMVDNFWEIASIIDRNSKVILTCRNEHFPQIKEGRSLLNAELRESTKYLSGENPQFEILQILKLSDDQIKKILINYTDKKTINTIFKNDEIVDLLQRPIMTDLIIDALKEIEEGRKIDLSRIYLYAIVRKMERDIKQERTFTSLADKLYFLCELSWEMISTDKLLINYKEFPDVIKNLFKNKVKDAELDYWRYDMRGQTILIIDEEDGNYKPAHKSFLEFFVAYKFAALLGVLSKDFIKVAQKQTNIDESKESEEYTWNEYFCRQLDSNGRIIEVAKLKLFKTEKLDVLINTVGKSIFSKAILDLIKQMIDMDNKLIQNILLEVIELCKGKKFEQVNYLVSNIVLLLLSYDKSFFKGRDLSNLCLREINIQIGENKKDIDELYGNYYDFRGTKFENSDLTKCDFDNCVIGDYESNLTNADFKNANLADFQFYPFQLDDLFLNEKKNTIVVGSCDDVMILDADTFNVLKRINKVAWRVKSLNNDDSFVHSGYGYCEIRNAENLDLIYEYKLSTQMNKSASEPNNLWTGGFEYANKSNLLFVACNNSYIYIYDIKSRKEIGTLQCFYSTDSLSLSFDEKYLVSASFYEVIIWELENNKKIYFNKDERDDQYFRKYNAKFHPKQNIVVITDERKVTFYDIDSSESIYEYKLEDCWNIDFSGDGSILCITNREQIYIFDFNMRKLVKIIDYEKVAGELLSMYAQLTEGINKIALSSDGKVLYLICNSKYLISIDLEKECIINKYLHMHNLRNCNYSGVKNMDIELNKYLIQNGAIID